MREKFPGYFLPSKSGFDELWETATFAFDANVLLDLYRLTSESRQLFFDVIEKLGGRLFLPHQAALEYLRRKDVSRTSRRSAIESLKADSAKLAATLRNRVEQDDLPKAKEIVDAADQAAKTVAKLVDAALKEEPDYTKVDLVLQMLLQLFEDRTGRGYGSDRLEEICARGAQRYALKIPPGYQNATKHDVRAYGDLILWFQLLDQARASKNQSYLSRRTPRPIGG